MLRKRLIFWDINTLKTSVANTAARVAPKNTMISGDGSPYLALAIPVIPTQKISKNGLVMFRKNPLERSLKNLPPDGGIFR